MSKGKRIAKSSQDPPAALQTVLKPKTPLDKDVEMHPVEAPLPAAYLLPHVPQDTPPSIEPPSVDPPSIDTPSTKMSESNASEAPSPVKMPSGLSECSATEPHESLVPYMTTIPPSSPSHPPGSPGKAFMFATCGKIEEEDMDIEGSTDNISDTFEQMNTACMSIQYFLFLAHICPFCSIHPRE